MKLLAVLLAAVSTCAGSTSGGLTYYRSGNHKRAFEIWLADSERGLRESQYHLALLYRDGEGVSKDLAEAQKWLERSAQAGCDAAQSELGWFLYTGKNGRPDFDQARAWYEKSIAQGNLAAMNRLGLMYFNGKGVPHDEARAVGLFQKSAVSVRAAMYNMGLVYETGRGQPQDLLQAVAWYSVAAEKGEPGAAKERDELGASFSPEQKRDLRSRIAAIHRRQMLADWRVNGLHYLFLLRTIFTFILGIAALIGHYWRWKTPHIHHEFQVATTRWRRIFLWYRPWGAMGWLLHAFFFLVLVICLIAFMAMTTLPVDEGWIGLAITLMVMLAFAHWVAIHRDRATFARQRPITGTE